MAPIGVIHEGRPWEETPAGSAHQPQAHFLSHSACKRPPDLFKLVLFLPTSRPFVVVSFFLLSLLIFLMNPLSLHFVLHRPS